MKDRKKKEHLLIHQLQSIKLQLQKKSSDLVAKEMEKRTYKYDGDRLKTINDSMSHKLKVADNKMKRREETYSAEVHDLKREIERCELELSGGWNC